MKLFRKPVSILLFASLFVFSTGSDCGGGKDGPPVDPLIEKAKDHYSEGRRLFLTCDPNNYAKANTAFENAIAYNDEYPEALAGWAENVSMWYGHMLPEKAFQKGYSYAQRSIRLDPELDMGYRAMADLFRHRKNPETGAFETDNALVIIEKALLKDPQSAENLYVKGSALMSSDPAQAVSVLRTALSINPELGKIHFNLSSCHQIIADKLIAEYQKDPEKNKDLEEEINKNYESASMYLDSYQKLVPGDLGGYCSMGIIKMRMNNIEESEENFQKAVSQVQQADISQNRWKIIAYLELAKIAEFTHKDLDKSRIYLERCLELAPNNVETLSQLIRVSKLLKDDEKALEYEQRIKEFQSRKNEKAEEIKKGPDTPKPPD